MIEEPVDFDVRDFKESDKNFVLSSWDRSCRRHFPWNYMTEPDYREHHVPTIRHSVNTGDILVACDVEDSDVIYGFIVGQELSDVVVIDYVFVKYAFRNMNIAKELIRCFGKDDKHFVLSQLPEKRSKLARLGSYVPHLLFRL